MPDITRRDFLGTTVASGVGLTAGLSAALHVSGAAAAESKDQLPVRMAVMGVNGRGKGLLSGFAGFSNVDIAYICDPDASVLPAAVKLVEDKGKKTPKVEKDFRVALDDPSVNVLVCAAPDHWHALSTIWACQAGKDVYVEKPTSHNPFEGRKMLEAARKYNRVVQVGTQRRSSPEIAAAVQAIRDGKIGDVRFARAWITSQRPNIGFASVSPAPENLDFDLWCGPGPNNGYKKNLIHYHWHWRWDYGTGECGNNGIHALDVARWGLGVEFPKTVVCGGGKYFFDDEQETPDTQLATFDFDGAAIQWEHRTWSPTGIDGDNYGVTWYGSKGALNVGNRGWKIIAGGKEVEKQDLTGYEKPHLQNFLDCLVSRDKPNADIEIGHRSTMLCHLANIALRTRSTVKFDAETESIIDNPAAVELTRRSSARKGFEVPEQV